MRMLQASARKPLRKATARGPWTLSDGSLEALKWVGLALMTGDHINKYLLNEASPALYDLGRMVMPIFGFVLMANLARPGALATGIHLRVMRRLAIFAALATPAFVLLVGWWPLNILATLFVATLIVYLIELGGTGSSLLCALTFIVGGALVEFWWPALLYCLGAWRFVRKPSAGRLTVWVIGAAALALINGNFAALVALPLIWGATQVDFPLQRRRWVFYAFYPAHLTVLAVVALLQNGR
jgi:hypothetical protein